MERSVRFLSFLATKFLEIYLDRTLSFNRLYVARCKIVNAVTNKSWDWSKNNMRKLYTSLQLSIMNYAAASWQPWLSKTNLEKIQFRIKLFGSLQVSTNLHLLMHSGLKPEC